MGNQPAWSTDNVNFTALPRYWRLGGRSRSTEEENVRHETGNGRLFVYNMYTRNLYELTFHIIDPDLQAFRDLHDYAAGESYPFYFSFLGASSSGASDSVYVRKEPGFDPKEIDKSRGVVVWEYTLVLKQELT